MQNMGRRVSMELDDEEIEDQLAPIAVAQKPRYSPGLRLCFCDVDLKKLGITELPPVGDLIDLRLFAEVTSVSDGEFGQRVEMQVTDILMMEDETTEEEM